MRNFVFEHLHGHGAPQEKRRIEVGKNILDANEKVAREVHELYTKRGVLLVNVVGSPGSGKTSFIKSLTPHFKVAVLEGDIASSVDAKQFARMGVPVIQVNTDIYGSACHLEAPWVRDKLELLLEYEPEVVFIENVGNLVCPSDFNLGEHERLVLYSVPEGPDKPMKYPPIFHTATAVAITKVDLAPVMELDVREFEQNVLHINPNVRIFNFSIKVPSTVEEVAHYLNDKRQELAKEKSK
ncbi:hydrogenase nickel incorporation protein HypB [Coprothermobacteraceae bacterium]|nr:hydrogenase nickel incorporation protein HypB [Coprothermobacteraceae bacterium]